MKLTAESEVRILPREVTSFQCMHGSVRLWMNPVYSDPSIRTFPSNSFDLIGDNGVILWQPEALSDEAD